MNDIHKMFVEGDQEIVRQATVGAGRTSLCWYPSSGFDFRHIRLLEEEAQMRGGRGSFLYICTDMLALRKPDGVNWDPDCKKWMLAMARGRIKESVIEKYVEVVRITELQPKIRIDRCTRDVYRFVPGEDTGRVFLLELKVETEKTSRAISAPMLFFISENLVFLVHFLLRNKIKVDTLVHIMDGCRMGGANRTMDFIHQVADILELNRVICGDWPSGRLFDYEAGCRVLKREINYFNKKMREIGEDANIEYRGFTKREICDTWGAELIFEYDEMYNKMAYEKYGRDLGRDNRYYDWRKIKPFPAEPLPISITRKDKSLIEAVKSGNTDKVSRLIAEGADINERDDGGNTPMHLAARGGSFSYMRRPFAFEAPSILAARQANIAIAATLIEAGADVNLRDKDGNTPLHEAAETDNYMHLRAEHEQIQMISELIAAGADVNALGKSGITPLMFAARGGQPEVVSHLIGAGADVNAKDSDGWTPFVWAAHFEHVKIISVLMAAGADVNMADRDGDTPLHLAVENGNLSIINALITSGADVNIENKCGISPLKKAEMSGHSDVIDALVAASGG